jgi:hypothetical protein
MTSRLLICTALVGLLGLAACGKQGQLDRPGPLFGSKRAQREAADRAKSEPNPDSSATSQTNGDYSQASDGAKDPALAPIRSNPPPGMPSSPFGSQSGGVIPDPLADPNRVPR